VVEIMDMPYARLRVLYWVPRRSFSVASLPPAGVFGVMCSLRSVAGVPEGGGRAHRGTRQSGLLCRA